MLWKTAFYRLPSMCHVQAGNLQWHFSPVSVVIPSTPQNFKIQNMVVFTDQHAHTLFTTVITCTAQCTLSPSKQHNPYRYMIFHSSCTEVIARFQIRIFLFLGKSPNNVNRYLSLSPSCLTMPPDTKPCISYIVWVCLSSNILWNSHF